MLDTAENSPNSAVKISCPSLKVKYAFFHARKLYRVLSPLCELYGSTNIQASTINGSSTNGVGAVDFLIPFCIGG
jgi:hypothetical protein